MTLTNDDSEQWQAPSPLPWRWRALLMLGVLAGLLAMHGLSPGGLGHNDRTPSAHSATMAWVSVNSDDGCPDGHCGGHAQHADVTCASGAVSGGPVLPALAADPAQMPVLVDVVRSHLSRAPDGGRAPPSLAELQLLRI